MSGIAEVLRDASATRCRGSDLAESAATRRLARARRRRSRSATTPRTSHGADAVVVSTAVAADNPEVARGARARHSGRAARADARRADAPEAGHRGRRHARQDDDDEPDRERARRRRPRSDVRHRRPPARGRRERAPRQRRLPRRRGRRVRRVVPVPARRCIAVVTNIDADHMETYGQRLRQAEARVRRLRAAPAVLRRRGAVRRRPERARDPARRSPSRSSPTASPTTRRCARSTSRNAGGRMRFVAHGAGAPTLAGRARRSPACTTCRTRSPRSRSAAKSACADAAIAQRARRIQGRRPPLPAPRRRRARRRRHVHADRRLRPSPGRDGGDARRRARELSRPPPRARVPAASLHAHARPVRGFRRACCRPPTRCVLAEVYPAGEAPIVAADGRALARAVRVAGTVEPVFVETVGDIADGDPRRRARRRRRRHDGRRLDRRRVPGAARADAGAHDDARARSRFAGLRGTLARDEPLARHTSWRVGGRPTCCYAPADRDDLAQFLRSLPADDAAHRARPRQQPAGPRRRHSRRRRAAAQPGRRARGRRRPRLRATPASRARSSRASRRCTAAPTRSSSPAFRAPSAARSR